MRQLKALPKKVLKRREVIAKDANIKRVCLKQGKATVSRVIRAAMHTKKPLSHLFLEGNGHILDPK